MYNEEFRSAAVRKVELRGGRSVRDIAHDLGISTWTLNQWRKQASMSGMKSSSRLKKKSSSSIKGKRSLAEKQYVLLATTNLAEKVLGEYLRREGLHTDDLERFRLEITEHLRGPSRAERSDENKLRLDKERLVKELRRKDRALAETTALLVLKKKADLLFGTIDEEDEE